MLTRRDLASGGVGGGTQLWKQTLSHRETPWQTEVIELKRGGKKKHTHTHTHTHTGKLPDHSNRQAHTPLYDPFRLPLQLWSCPKVYKPLTAIFFFPPFPGGSENRASRRPLTRHSRKCGTSSESQRNRAGGRSFVLWLGAAPARWLTLLAGWPANCLADWWRSRNMIQTQQQSCLLQEIVLTFWEETHSFSLQSRVRWEDRYQSHDNMKLQPAAN